MRIGEEGDSFIYTIETQLKCSHNRGMFSASGWWISKLFPKEKDHASTTKVLPVSTCQRSWQVNEADGQRSRRECEAHRGECSTGWPELLGSYSRDQGPLSKVHRVVELRRGKKVVLKSRTIIHRCSSQLRPTRLAAQRMSRCGCLCCRRWRSWLVRWSWENLIFL